jgi:hypothetical protein
VKTASNASVSVCSRRSSVCFAANAPGAPRGGVALEGVAALNLGVPIGCQRRDGNLKLLQELDRNTLLHRRAVHRIVGVVPHLLAADELLL